MSNVLIVGNVIKDIYLGLDGRQNSLEYGENDTPWMDLAFDGSTHQYYRRTSVFNGAAIAKKVLSDFGFTATISTTAGDFPTAYQYILCADDKVTRLMPFSDTDTEWKAPAKVANWILVDRSAKITNELVSGIKAYLSVSGRTRLAVFVSSRDEDGSTKTWSNAERELVSTANLIFVDGFLPENVKKRGVLCEIDKDFVQIGQYRRYFSARNAILASDKMSIQSILSATVMGALLRGRTVNEALDFAKANVENAVLNDTLELEALERKVNSYRNRRRDLRLIAKVLMAPGKGILAADESEKSIHERFAKYAITDDQKHRRDYRNLLISTEGLDQYLSGIILFDETVHQKMLNGQDFTTYLTNHGIVGGIKVDKGLQLFPAEDIGEHKALPNDTWTKGLSDLLPRVKEYYQMGLRFAKWRSAFRIDASDFAIRKNAKDMARYAYICQEEGLVPIIEPELLFDGDYNINDSAVVTAKILDEVFGALRRESVDLSACILKTNMIIGGKQREASSSEEVGLHTAEVLREHVPEELAGVVFLSGGQGVEQATANLHQIIKHGPYPWPATFSFARALQEPVLTTWKGQEENAATAQQVFLKRLKENIEALKN